MQQIGRRARYCPATLSDLRAGICAPDGGGAASDPHVADCHEYRSVSFHFVDSGVQYYFDATSGNLVAIVNEIANAGGVTVCSGGPATFAPPSCQPDTPLCG